MNVPQNRCYQINMQCTRGGGEVYTIFLTRVLLSLGIPCTLFAHQNNKFWVNNLPAEVEIIPLPDIASLAEKIRQISGWVLVHSPISPQIISQLKAPERLLSSIAHMPVYDRKPSSIAAYDYFFGVSEHVLESLRAAGISQVHPEPLFGIADLQGRQFCTQPLFRNTRYDWDRRKVRDRLLGYLSPLYEQMRPRSMHHRRPGITLGIVSRITPIKQFPKLFSLLAPILAKHPQIHLDIFGAGGYASVRDLDRALAPVRAQVRYWGHQSQVGQVYANIDYLMTGLPEKEALGLNIIEAQVSGVPVLAPGKKPFTETIAEGLTGFFYTDPREDQGASFDALLSQLEQKPLVIDQEAAKAHLYKFSEAAFRERIERMLEAIRRKNFLPAA